MRTEHYGLKLWGAREALRWEGVNENFAALDETLSGLLVFGSYSGNGASSRGIALGFQPRAVYLCSQKGMAGIDVTSKYIYGGLILPDLPLQRSSSEVAAKLTATGFSVYMPTGYLRVNQSGERYFYFAVK